MCGIFGFTNKVENQLELLKKMGNAQIHRGPDGEGYYVDSYLSFGMRRLSILDIENGNQPFFNTDKSIVVFCNGEIYNYVELKSELVSEGFNFKTNCDIEVIPFLYEKYGIDFISKLNGMFAIAIYDINKGELYLIRDRLGIKPLYYSYKNGDVIFSSEIKSIFEVNNSLKEIDFDAISTYLELMYIPQPLTPFKDIKKLMSGCFLKFTNKEYKIARYWNPELSEFIENETECLQQMERIISDSVKIQLRSDVPLGCFLSGGVDSSAVTAFASKISDIPVKTFHIDWDNASEKTNETEYAKSVSKKYKTEHFVKSVSEEILVSRLGELIYYLEEPMADGAFIPTFALSEFASKNITVILSGAGGDELFGGYFRHKYFSKLKSLITKIINSSNPSNSYFDRVAAKHSYDFDKYFKWFKRGTFKKKYDKIFLDNKDKDELNAVLLSDLNHYLQDDIMFLTDKMTMASSIECRLPLLDHRLVELSLKIPSNYKIKDCEKKVIFKKFLKKIIPDDILNRKKEGFGAPIATWMNKYRDYFDSVIKSGYMMNNGLIEKFQLFELLKNDKLDGNNSWIYWKILVLEIWFRIFINDEHYKNIIKN